jgi:hypothetical protein
MSTRCPFGHESENSVARSALPSPR